MADELGGGFSGGNYSFGNGTSPGLSAPDQSGTDGYGFSGTSPGLTAPSGYDIGGGLGSSLGSWNDSYTPTDYSLSSLWNLNDAGYGDASGVGLTAVPSQSPSSLGFDPNKNGFSSQDEGGFWGSKAQKIMSFFANMNPVTSLINAGASALNSQDPVKAAIQGLLGKFGGTAGQIANTGYNVATSRDPLSTGLGVGGALVGGQLGGALAGSQGASIGSNVLGNALRTASASNPSYGAYGSGSAVNDTLGRVAAGSTGFAPTSSPERNWTDTAMSLASGIYGMKQAGAQRDLASVASAPSAAASAQLQKVVNGDFTGDAGYEAAMKAAARSGSQQPGGYAASAAAQAALKYQNDRIATLSGATNSGVSTALTGNNSANSLASASLGSLGFGTSSGTQMPAWLQSYMIKNGLGSASNA
jgi:hypothetical protein